MTEIEREPITRYWAELSLAWQRSVERKAKAHCRMLRMHKAASGDERRLR